MNVAKVFLDTNVLKFAATELPRLRPRKQSLDWGGKTIEVIVHDFVEVNPNELIENPTLKTEVELLPRLAAIGKLGELKYVMNSETIEESWGLRNMDSKNGRFYGVPIEVVKAPFEYARIMAGGGVKPKERQFRFLASIRHERFLELQKMTGAYQGEQKLKKLNRNQLLDAFHIWCAEHNGCEFLLTLDFKLIKVLSLSPTKSTVRVVRPSELLAWLERLDWSVKNGSGLFTAK
jgi:hypothetical protein